MNNRTIKKKSLPIIYIRLTFDGSFQRTKIYKPKVKDHKRKEFRVYMASQLKLILSKILKTKKYKDVDHYRTIIRFSNSVTREHHGILRGNKFRIGNAQKFINLYWKVCWLLKRGVKRPIHCPFDSIILGKLGSKAKNKSWTKTTDINDYKVWVKIARDKAKEKGKTIAEWELEKYIEAVNYE